MSCGRHRWGLGSLLLLLAGRNLGVLIEMHQDSINGTAGQAVLLPVSYRFDGAPGFPVPIQWMFRDSPDALISCTVSNCSLGAGGTPSSCSARYYTRPAYRGRVEVFPENGSLLLRDLRLSDSGAYGVTFTASPPTRHITLTVHEPCFAPDCPAGTANQKDYYVIGICSSISVLLFLLFCYIGYRGVVHYQKRKIIKQQQVSSVESSHMPSTGVRDMNTIYARIGDRFEQPQPTLTGEVTYTSIISSSPPKLDTGPYHILV